MRISKTGGRLLSLLVLAAFLLAGNALLRELLEPVSYSAYFCHELDELEAAGTEADLIFVGGSRVYRSYVPEVFEERLGLDCVINAGSSSQPIGATYWQLKDLLERFHPRHVVLGVTWGQLTTEQSLQGALLVYDRLRGMNRLRYAADCLWDEGGLLYTLYPYRFRSNLGKAGSIYAEKRALSAADYAPDISAGTEYYAGKGFIYSRRAAKPGNIGISHPGGFSEDAVRPESLRYLDGCVALCREAGATLSLVTGPTSLMQLYYLENYQGAVDFYERYAAEHGLVYHNLNYLRDRETLLPDTLMHDYNHVNGEGAYVVSRLYAEILERDLQGTGTDGFFYRDLEELKAGVNRIAAVGAEITPESPGRVHIRIVSLQNRDILPRYRVELSEDGGEHYETAVDWTVDTDLDVAVPEEADYRLRITAGAETGGAGEAWQVYKRPK